MSSDYRSMVGSSVTTNLRSRVSKKEVRLHDLIPSGVIGSSAAGKVCLVCTTNVSSYCCPQCYIPYCSSQCYLRHDVGCTETFSRQRVKSVLDLEARENTGATKTAEPDLVSYRNFSDGVEFSQNEKDVRDRFITEEEDNEDDYDSDENPDLAIGTAMNTLNLSTMRDGGLVRDGEAQVGIDISNIEKMPPRALARLVKLWTPWWTAETPENKLTEVLSSKKRGLTSAISKIKKTAPKLNTLVRTEKLTRDLGYQILGLILGYVVTMRSLNGDWQENVPSEGSEKNVLSAPFEALNFICLSTPSLDASFKPSSVIETIESWVRFRPYSLQNISRKKIKSLLEDAFSILKYSEFLSFSLIEVWLIAYTCGTSINIENNDHHSNNDDLKEIERKVKETLLNLENENFPAFSDNFLHLMDSYSEKFRNKSPLKKSRNLGKSGDKNLELIQSDLLARKSFFLLLYTLDINRVKALEELVVELKDYLNSYID